MTALLTVIAIISPCLIIGVVVVYADWTRPERSAAETVRLAAEEPDAQADYPRIRRLEQSIYGEWFTLDGLDQREQERMRPGKVARMFEVEQGSTTWLA